MRNTTEVIWIIFFILLYCILTFFFIKYTLKKRKQKREQEQQEAIAQIAQRQAEIQIWQQELRAKAEQREQQQAQKIAENMAKCATLDGFLAERQVFYDRIIEQSDYAIRHNYENSSKQRIHQIIWDSLELIFESQNGKTIESRLEIVFNNIEKLGYSPIDEHELRITITHSYMQQINILQDKITQYKVTSAKQKAIARIHTWIERGQQDKQVYQQAFSEFCHLCLSKL